MNFTLKVWRQKNMNDDGRLVTYLVQNISPDASFLEMLDVLNAELARKGEDVIEFDHDCREGICGSCGVVINGRAHGPGRGSATCELRMRSFRDGTTVVVEPWRAKSFPVLKDLVVDRTAFDRIMQAGGYTSAKTGGVPDGNAIPIPKAAEHASRLAQTPPPCCSLQQGSLISRSFLRDKLSGKSAPFEWSSKWITKVSGTARTTMHAKPSARRRFQ
ncbi:MAG: fumarate reductase [Bacteroidetes bacterium]|nr:fumarate reductase [Bacteroidota bacterium]